MKNYVDIFFSDGKQAGKTRTGGKQGTVKFTVNFKNNRVHGCH